MDGYSNKRTPSRDHEISNSVGSCNAVASIYLHFPSLATRMDTDLKTIFLSSQAENVSSF